jgi:ATP-dependent helicase HrpA
MECIQEKKAITQWTFGILPESIEKKVGQFNLTAYPALLEHKDKTHCVIDVFDSKEQAQQVHIQGLKRLFALQLKEHIKKTTKDLMNQPSIGIDYASLGSAQQLYEQIIDCAIYLAFLPDLAQLGHMASISIYQHQKYIPHNAEEFKYFLEQGKQRFGLLLQQVKLLTINILKTYVVIDKKLQQLKHSKNQTYAYAVQDMQEQLTWLIPANFLSIHAYTHLKRFNIYLQGMQIRLEKISTNIQDQKSTLELNTWQKKWQQQHTIWKNQGLVNILGDKYMRFLELPYAYQELRLVLFAQSLKSAYPISFKRLEKMWNELVNA